MPDHEFDHDKIVASAHDSFSILAKLTQAVVADVERNGHISIATKVRMGDAVAHIMKHVKQENAHES